MTTNDNKYQPVSEEEKLQQYLDHFDRDGWPKMALAADIVRSLRSRLSEKEEECEKLRLFIQELPGKLRSSLSGHKGEAYRIALQMCEEILSITKSCKSQ